MRILQKFFMLVMLAVSGNALASGVTINASDYSHLPIISSGMNIRYSALERTAAMVQLVGAYRAEHGVFSVPINSVVKFKWADGSSEKGKVVALSGSDSVLPVPGTESKPPNGGIGYTTYPNGNSYGGSNVIGFTPIYATQTVCVGGYCESILVVTGYQFIYGAGGGPRDQVV